MARCRLRSHDDATGCERAFAIGDLAKFYGPQRTVADALQQMRCTLDCGGRVAGAWLTTGPILNARVRPRRVPLRGPEARELLEGCLIRLLCIVSRSCRHDLMFIKLCLIDSVWTCKAHG